VAAGNWSAHLKANPQSLVEFDAPWCGQCKKLDPELEKAALNLKSRGVAIAKVDATDSKELASKYNVKTFPTFVWFEEGRDYEFNGENTAGSIEEWVVSMTGPAVLRASAPVDPPTGARPTVVLYAHDLLPGFEQAAKESRKKAVWMFVSTPGSNDAAKLVLSHPREEEIVLRGPDCGRKEKVLELFKENVVPMFGPLDDDTWDIYMEAGTRHKKGLIWSLFADEDEDGVEAVQAKHRPMMLEVAKRVRGKYYVTYTDTELHKDTLENVVGTAKFPAIAVQTSSGHKWKYIYEGPLTVSRITAFVQDVESGIVSPRLRSESERAGDTRSRAPVTRAVSTTLERIAFTPNKDVLLYVTAPWCGHCKKLDPECQKLGEKIQSDRLDDLITIAKIDGVANDSPLDSLEWTSFPTLWYIKAGQSAPMVFEGERTAKALWKFIRKHATKADEIIERIDRLSRQRAEEL